MSKIICDVCGTRYPDTAEQCPICGRVRVSDDGAAAEKLVEEEVEVVTRTAVRGGRFSKANVRKRNKNQPRYEEQEDLTKARAKTRQNEEEEYDPYEEYEEEPEKKSGVVLNILLTIVIIALLAVSAYIFVEIFMPNIMDDKLPAPTAESTEPTQTQDPTEEPTDEPTVPCMELSMDMQQIVLEEMDQMYLLNVAVFPENTTDPLMFTSGDEAVVIVNEEGRVTAVGEGETVIYIFCGEQTLECSVSVSFAEPTEEPTEDSAEDPTEDSAEDPTEEPTEAPTEDPDAGLKDVTLSLKQSDVTFRAKGQQATFKLTCDLKSNEVTWISEDENIVTVDENGVVTRVGKGTTNIIVKYGSQEVKVIVRCPA